MTDALKSAGRLIFRYLVTWHVFFVLVPLYRRSIRQILANGATVPARQAEPGDLSILVLSSEFYRKDPQVLAGHQGVRVLVVPQRWQTRLIFQFYPKGRNWFEYLNPKAGSDVSLAKAEFRAFLRKFLPRLYSVLSVDCVVAPHLHYVADADWGAVSEELGKPFVVLQRENMALTSFLRDHITWRIRHMGKFEGSKIIVHNAAMRTLYEDSGVATNADVVALGCVRMDDFVERARNACPPNNERKQIVYFPFYLGTTFDERIRPFFNKVHVCLVEFAKNHPAVDVLIKPKEKFESSWRLDFDRAMRDACLTIGAISNLRIDHRGDAQDIILAADVVAGLQTTTLLEAGLAGRPVVIPYFGEIDTTEFNERVMFYDEFASFLVARSEEEFVTILDGLVERSVVADSNRSVHEKVFSKLVSDVNGGACARYVEALRNSVQKAHVRRI